MHHIYGGTKTKCISVDMIIRIGLRSVHSGSTELRGFVWSGPLCVSFRLPFQEYSRIGRPSLGTASRRGTCCCRDTPRRTACQGRGLADEELRAVAFGRLYSLPLRATMVEMGRQVLTVRGTEPRPAGLALTETNGSGAFDPSPGGPSQGLFVPFWFAFLGS